MKIIQISAVVENNDTGSEDRGTFRRLSNKSATIYGLSDDSKLYVYGVTKSTPHRNTNRERDQDPELPAISYKREYGWLLVN